MLKNRVQVWQEVAKRTGYNPKLVNFVLKQYELTLKKVIIHPENATDVRMGVPGVHIGTFRFALKFVESKIVDMRHSPYRKNVKKADRSEQLINQYKIDKNEYSEFSEGRKEDAENDGTVGKGSIS